MQLKSCGCREEGLLGRQVGGGQLHQWKRGRGQEEEAEAEAEAEAEEEGGGGISISIRMLLQLSLRGPPVRD